VPTGSSTLAYCIIAGVTNGVRQATNPARASASSAAGPAALSASGSQPSSTTDSSPPASIATASRPGDSTGLPPTSLWGNTPARQAPAEFAPSPR
jgi:hypothetical protein